MKEERKDGREERREGGKKEGRRRPVMVLSDRNRPVVLKTPPLPSPTQPQGPSILTNETTETKILWAVEHLLREEL